MTAWHEGTVKGYAKCTDISEEDLLELLETFMEEYGGECEEPPELYTVTFKYSGEVYKYEMMFYGYYSGTACRDLDEYIENKLAPLAPAMFPCRVRYLYEGREDTLSFGGSDAGTRMWDGLDALREINEHTKYLTPQQMRGLAGWLMRRAAEKESRCMKEL